MPVVAHEAPPVGAWVELWSGNRWQNPKRVVESADGTLCVSDGLRFHALAVPGVNTHGGRVALLDWRYAKCGECGARSPGCVDCSADAKPEDATYPSVVHGLAAWCHREPTVKRLAAANEFQDAVHAWWDRHAPPTEDTVSVWDDFEFIAEAMVEVWEMQNNAARALVVRNVAAFARCGHKHRELAQATAPFLRLF